MKSLWHISKLSHCVLTISVYFSWFWFSAQLTDGTGRRAPFVRMAAVGVMWPIMFNLQQDPFYAVFTLFISKRVKKADGRKRSELILHSLSSFNKREQLEK